MRLHHVKKARKSVPHAGIRVGDPYWWAKAHMRAPKLYWIQRPKDSELISSEYLRALAEMTEEAEALTLEDSEDDLGMQAALDDFGQRLEDLGQEQQDKLDNMPEGLQQGAAGNTLQERVDACQGAASTVQSIDTSFDPEDGKEGEDSEVERNDARWQEFIGELTAGIDEAAS